MTPSARKRLPQREQRTPRRPRPQPGPERPQPMMIAATIPDELAARVPGDSADRGDFRRRGPNRVFEEGRSSAVDGRGAMVEAWPTIGPSLGPPRCNSDEPERSHKTQRREKESRETGHFFPFRFGSRSIPLRSTNVQNLRGVRDFLTPDGLGSCRKSPKFRHAHRSLMQSYGCGSAAPGPLWLIVF